VQKSCSGSLAAGKGTFLEKGVLVAVTLVCLFAPSEFLLEIAFLATGAGVACAVSWLHRSQSASYVRASNAKVSVCKPSSVGCQNRCSSIAQNVTTASGGAASDSALDSQAEAPQTLLLPWRFEAEDYHGQVEELVPQLCVPAAAERAAQHIHASIAKAVGKILPNVSVVVMLGGNPLRGGRRDVSVPEVDVVALADDSSLSEEDTAGRLKHLKTTLRSCTNAIVYRSADFRFRRSAFKGPEPKVTLLAQLPAWMGGKAVAVDFSVNSLMPARNAALLSECGRLTPGLLELILFVKCWAKERGVCHSSVGHLPAYAWTLLCIYFMQVVHDGRQRVPALKDLRLSLAGGVPSCSYSCVEQAGTGCQETTEVAVGKLFRKFIEFYSCKMDWRTEGVCVRLGQRAMPSATTKPQRRHEDALPLAESVAGLSRLVIEDPFDASSDVGLCLSDWGLERLYEELSRAHALLAEGATLEALLHPWEPPTGDRTKSADLPEAASVHIEA